MNGPRERIIGIFCVLMLMSLFLIVSRVSPDFKFLFNHQGQVRSWFVEMNLADRPVAVQNEFVTEKMERDIGNIKGVSDLFSVSMHTRVVVAFLTSKEVEVGEVESQVRAIASAVLADPANRFESPDPLLIVSKPVGEYLRGVKRPDPNVWSGFGPAQSLQHEIITLFGNNGVYDESIGLLRHIKGDLRVWIDGRSALRQDYPESELILNGLAKAFVSLPNIQTVVVRDLVHRVNDLTYSAAEALRLGVTPGDLLRAVSTDPRSEANTVSVGKAAGAAVIYPELDFSGILGRTLDGKNGLNFRIEDLVQVRPHHMVISGVLGSNLRSWYAEEVQANRKGAGVQGNNRRPYLEITLQSRAAQEKTVEEIGARLNELKADWGDFAFGIDVLDQSASNRKSGLESLLWIFFALTCFVIFIPNGLVGANYVRSVVYSAFLFFGISLCLSLDLTLERMATAFTVFFIFSFVRELPNTRQLSLKKVKKILSERMELFLILLIVSVLFSVTVVDVKLEWSESQHMLTFLTASLAVVMSAFFSAHVVSFDSDEMQAIEWNPFYRFLAASASILMLLPLLERQLIDLSPSGFAIEGKVELGRDEVDFIKPISEIDAHLRDFLGSAVQVVGGAAPSQERQFFLRTNGTSDYKLTGSLVSDIFTGLDPVVSSRIALRDSNQAVLVRLVDRDVVAAAYSKPAQFPGRDPLVLRMEQGALPASLLRPDASAARLAAGSRERGLSSLIEAVESQSLARDVRAHGRSVFLFRAWGDDPQGQHGRLKSELGFNEFFSRLGFDGSRIDIDTNLEMRKGQERVAMRLFWISSLLIFGFGAIFFGSLKGGVQTFLTFMLSYGFTKPITVAVYHLTGRVYAVSVLELQIASMSCAIILLCLWGFIAADTNASRKANISLQLAFGPIFFESRRWIKILLGVWSVALVLGLSLIPFRFFSGIILCGIFGLTLFPYWVYFLSEAEELSYRALLRARVSWSRRLRVSGGGV